MILMMIYYNFNYDDFNDDYLQVTTFWRRHGLQCSSLLLWRSSTPRCEYDDDDDCDDDDNVHDDDDDDDSNSDNDSDDHVSFTVPAQFHKIHRWINLRTKKTVTVAPPEPASNVLAYLPVYMILQGHICNQDDFKSLK